MIAFYGQHVLNHSSNVQSTIALSTGESEYYALVKGGSAGLGIQSLLADYGMQLSPSSQTRTLQRVQSTMLDLAKHAISKPDTCGCRKE